MSDPAAALEIPGQARDDVAGSSHSTTVTPDDDRHGGSGGVLTRAATADQGTETVEVARPALRVLGVRHHGPGSARAVVRALEAQDPQIVLIEGPPEADVLVEWVGRGLVPPVALLAYDQAAPQRASFWPFAEFSPEWQALAWAVRNRREVRFCDLPAVHSLASREDDEDADPSTSSGIGKDDAEPGTIPEPVEGPDDP